MVERVIDDHAPLRLAAACARAFPNGDMTVHGLRKEAKRGRLTIWRIAGKDFTTIAAIKEMLELCRVQASRQDYVSGPTGSTRAPEGSYRGHSGSSSTGGVISPRDALLTKLQKLKSGSQSI